MIQTYVEQFQAAIPKLREAFSREHPAGYKEILVEVVRHLKKLDPERVHEIDDGDYQGTLVYVIGEEGYQPSEYITARVFYGSCSGCDTLQAIHGDSDDPPTPEQVTDYITLAHHMVCSFHRVGGEIA